MVVDCGRGATKECDSLKFDGPGAETGAVGGLASGDGDLESVKSITARWAGGINVLGFV